MIAAVVFSKDRACQLDLLLTSLERNGGGLFDPTVMYKATSPEHARAYRMCAARFPNVLFLPDSVRAVANRMKTAEYGCFFTDDSVLYRRPPLEPRLHPDVLCFSLRLGLNTTWCYPYNSEQAVPDLIVKTFTLRWDWITAEGDFGYPASVDGHIFRGKDLANALQHCRQRSNPNQIEEHLVTHFKYDPRTLMSSYPESCLVGLPVNTVTDTHNNRHGERHAHSTDGLLQHYLAGKRIQLAQLDFTNIRGAHQELGLVLA